MSRTTLTLALAATLGLTACGGSTDPLAEDTADDTAEDNGAATDDGAGAGSGGGDAVTVGSANFPENELLAEIYAAALEDAGVTVETSTGIGSREVYMAALEDGSIDVLPEYTGGLATYLDPEITATSSEDVLASAEENLPEGLELLEISDAENKDSIVVRGETAEEDGLTTIADLEPYAAEMTLGGPPEFETRPNGVDGLKERYGLTFAGFRSLAAGSTLTVQALATGQVDAANIFTTDPGIEENGFVVLEDPEHLFAAQNVVPLVRSDALTPEAESALNDVSAGLDTETLTAMMVQVLTDGEAPADVARGFVDGL